MTRRDNLPPCPRCGGLRGAHEYACPVPAIARTSRTLGNLKKVSGPVLLDAMLDVSMDTLIKLQVALESALANRSGQ